MTPVNLPRRRSARATGSVCREELHDRVGGPGADDARQLLARRAADAGEAAELVSSALRRRGPMPGTASSSDRRSRVERCCRWKVTAKRCASSRMRCSSRSAGPCGSMRDRQIAVAHEHQLLLLREADRDQVREPDLLERLVGRVQLSLAAVDHDQIRETVRRPRARARSGGRTTCFIAAKSSRNAARAGRSGPIADFADCQQGTVPFSECLRSRHGAAPSPGGRGTCDTRSSSSGRPRTPPARPPSRCPGSSRCRSTRCGAAAPAASGSPSAGRARRSCAVAAVSKRVRYAKAALRCASSTMSFLSPRCGTTMRTLRSARADSHASSTSLLGRLDRHVNLRRRHVVGVELLQRDLEQLGFDVGRATPRLARRPVCSSKRSITRPPRNTNTCTTAPSVPELHADDIAIVEAGGRHLLLPLAHRVDRADRVAQLRRLLVALVRRRPRIMRSRSCPASSSLRPSRNSRVSATATRVALLGADRRDARRQAAADVVLEARPRPHAGDHLVARPDAEHLVRQRHRPPRELRRQERAGEEVAVLLDVRAPPARAGTPRSSSAADTGSSCRRAAGCCSAG